MIRTIFIFAVCLIASATAFGQMPDDKPRIDDHFQRWKTYTRIDLSEKVNRPLNDLQFTNAGSIEPIYEEALYPDRYGVKAFDFRKGIVDALLKSLYDGKVATIYESGALHKPMTKEAAIARLERISGFQTEETEGGGEEGGGEELGTDEGDGSGDPGEEADAGAFQQKLNAMKDFCNKYIDLVEDRIFEKNKSDMYYDIQYICVTPENEANPKGTGLCFAWDDVKEILDETQWKNRFNDAEHRTAREIFELRLFHCFSFNITGYNGNDLNEYELFKQKMIEFEHHLWSQ